MTILKRLIFTLTLMICTLTVRGQKNNGNDFYSSFKTFLTNNNSIELSSTEYLCLGDQNNWKVSLNDNGDKTDIRFYSKKTNSESISNKSEFYLDTIYTVSKKELIQKIESEKKEIENRLILIETSHNISLKTNRMTKELVTIKMSGLYYILRYNKTYETYFD